jgi:hypothetical protein
MSIFEALFTITVYTVVAFTSVGVPLMAQVALSIHIIIFPLTVNPAAPNIANAVDQIATIGSAIRDITFNNSGGAIASCTVAPTLQHV